MSTKEKKLKIELKKSFIAGTKQQESVANSLGLKKIGDTTVQPDNPATRGKIRKINHLVSIEEA
ncbi:MAG: 50S ribosomal protein L30 [Clostridia bacterium]|nr:50S ribosomal protein L30 [Clostridia bacterium]